MRVNTRSRAIVYSILLFFSVSEVAFGVLNGLTAGFTIFGGLIGLVMAIVAFVMIIWCSILLAYNNQPTSTHKLTRIKAHALSLLIFSPMFFLLSALLTVNAPFTCLSVDWGFGFIGSASSCVFAVVATVQGWLLSILTIVMAVHLLEHSKLDGFEKNVAGLHADVSEYGV
ncbi:hypothetical protein QCA50_000030 [Cerrena zonata]|uniref:MARVEL domain-containing protein n=1 Tax=Cerrena zonata TaxID=2478898 RepID=A0AAW0GZI3_9APHY